jgi:zinc protease
LPLDPVVTHGTLSNGMTYYIRHNEEPRNRVQLMMVVRAGSVLEEESERGLAHFAEHMAFNGTERFAKQQIVEYLESLGVNFGPDLNASTGFDTTTYELEVPTDDPKVLETAFQILSDWAYAISFDPEEVEKERGVVIEEWRSSLGYSDRFLNHWVPLVFGSSRYTDRLPIGLLEVLETATAEDLRGFYERWYRPNLMAVVVVGDIDVAEMEAAIKRNFAPPPEGEAMQARAAIQPPTERPRYPVPSHAEPRVTVFTDPEATGTSTFLVRTIPSGYGVTLSAYRDILIERLSFMLFNTRLFELSRTPNPPYLGASAYRSGLSDTADILVFGVGIEKDGVETGLGAILEELQRVRQHGFTVSELEREKANLLSQMESYYERRGQLESRSLAEEYIEHFLSATVAPGIEMEWELTQHLLPQITIDEVDAFAYTWSEPGNTVLLVTGPEDIGPGTPDELKEAVTQQLIDAHTLEVAGYEDESADQVLLATIPTAGSITAEKHIESIDAVQWTLSNGITVVAKQTDFNNDQVLFRSFSPGGTSLVPDEDYYSATHAASLVAGSGAGPHDSVALDKLLAGKRVGVSPYIGSQFEGLSGSASPQDLETMFQLITLYATEPKIDPVYFETYVTRLRDAAENRLMDPDTLFFDEVRRILFQDHYRRRPLTVEILDELGMERALAIYADRFADIGDSTFVFVGAFDWDALRSLTETYLASLPTSGRTEQWSDPNIDPPATLEDHEVYFGIEPRSTTILIFAGDFDWSLEESLAVALMGEILQIRLREEIREELGGTYGVSVSASTSSIPDSEYQIYAYFGSDPDRVEELFAAIQRELNWLIDGGEQKYLDTAKELFRSSREEQVEENSFWLSQVGTLRQRGLPLDTINSYLDRLDAVTLEEVSAAAERYLTLDQYIRVVLFPQEEE